MQNLNSLNTDKLLFKKFSQSVLSSKQTDIIKWIIKSNISHKGLKTHVMDGCVRL